MRSIFIKSAIGALAVIATAVAVYTTTTSSRYEPKIERMEQGELKEWSNRNDTILRNNKPVAIFEHYEYELNPNHRRPAMQAELCFIQIDDESENTVGLIRYIHTMHPSSKVQVEFKEQYERIKTWEERIK